MKKIKLGIIGYGYIARALVAGLNKSKTKSYEVFTSHPSSEKKKTLSKECTVLPSIQDVAKESDLLILSVKPYALEHVLKSINIKQDTVVVSLAAGKTIDDIGVFVTNPSQVLRAMPNVPISVCQGVTAISTSQNTHAMKMASDLFECVGTVVHVPETSFDAVTALSGSGPAFIFTMIDALSDGGVKMGLSRSMALSLAAQTMMGSAKLLIESKEHPGKLKDSVTSPAGTAITGLHTLEKGGLRNTLINAIEASCLKAAELSKK